MPILDITNPEVIKFLVENYEKTAQLRMRWNYLNRDKLKQTAILKREEKGHYITDVLKHSMVADMNTIATEHKSCAGNRRKTPIRDAIHIPAVADLKKGHSIVDVGLGNVKEDPRLARPDTDLTFDPIMRPVDPNETKIIYKGIPEFGRALYVKTRNKLMPEKKYYFSQSYGWSYGWRLKDSYFGRNVPKYGRVWHLTHGTRSRSGPQPDPDHYRELEVSGANTCS